MRNSKGDMELAKMLILKAYKTTGELKCKGSLNPMCFEVMYEDDKSIYVANDFCFYLKGEDKRRWCYRIFKTNSVCSVQDRTAPYKFVNPDNFKVYKSMEELDADASNCPFEK